MPQEARPPTPWSFRIATIAGIPVRLHVLTLLALLYIGFIDIRAGEGYARPLLLIAAFACLLAHEFGHALTARMYGVSTRDITLYPIGGLAMLEGRLKNRAELVVALAGPAVNLVITGLLWVAIPLVGPRTEFLRILLTINLGLALFNLLPAFPMDGGRVLRAALSIRIGEERATAIASTVGQALALCLVVAGVVLPALGLVLIGFFVFLGAGQEGAQVQQRSLVTGRRLGEAMQTRFRTLTSGDSLDLAAKMLLEGSQHDFPVMIGDEIYGLLTRQQLVRGLSMEGGTGYVGGFADREPRVGHPDMPLEEVLEMMAPDENSPILVLEDGHLVGMVTRDNLSEFLTLAAIPRLARPASE